MPGWLEMHCPVLCFRFHFFTCLFPLSLLFSCFSFFLFLQLFKITTALLMYPGDDYPLRLGFCSWTCPREPHHPRCNRQEQKKWKETRGKNSTELQQRTQANLKAHHHHHSPPPHIVYGRRSTCLPWRLLNPHLTLGDRYTKTYWSYSAYSCH